MHHHFLKLSENFNQPEKINVHPANSVLSILKVLLRFKDETVTNFNIRFEEISLPSPLFISKSFVVFAYAFKFHSAPDIPALGV